MSIKNLYQINLPIVDNKSRSAIATHIEWRAQVLFAIGGYTRLSDVTGIWINDAGKRFSDISASYQIACDAETWRELIALAFKLFPDQEAIFHARIGTATIEERENHGKI